MGNGGHGVRRKWGFQEWGYGGVGVLMNEGFGAEEWTNEIENTLYARYQFCTIYSLYSLPDSATPLLRCARPGRGARSTPAPRPPRATLP